MSANKKFAASALTNLKFNDSKKRSRPGPVANVISVDTAASDRFGAAPSSSALAPQVIQLGDHEMSSPTGASAGVCDFGSKTRKKNQIQVDSDKGATQ